MQILLLMLGVFFCSISVIFIKMSAVDPVLLSGLRLVVAVAILAPVFVRDWRRHRERFRWRRLGDSVAPGVGLALHLITWIIGARLTPAANSTLIVNVVPVVMPLLLWALVRERVTRQELTGTLAAMAGLSVLFAADYQLSGEHFRGDTVCFGSMLLLAYYLSLGRKHRDHPSIWLYMVPLYAVSAVVCLAAAVVVSDWGPYDWRREAPLVFCLGLFPTVLGHSLINNAMRHLRGQVVSLLVMTQFIMAGLIAYPVLGEAPHGSFYAASAAVVVGCVLATRGR